MSDESVHVVEVRCCYAECDRRAMWNLSQITPAIHPADGTTHVCDEHVMGLVEDRVIRYELTRIEAVGLF